MDFQKLLLELGNSLRKDEVKALTFLCSDLLGRNLNSVEEASDLFSRLVDQDYLSPEQPHLLTELLLTIQRTRLVRELNLQSADSCLISPYRKLLYNLSEEITDDVLKQIKFLLNKTLPRRKLEENVTMLEVFLELEHMDYLSETNLDKLETIFQSVFPVLREKINQFKALQRGQASPVVQETGQPKSHSFQPNQGTTGSYSDKLDALTKTGKQTHETVNRNSEVLRSYPMRAAKRGICLIINNYNFAKTLKTREGTNIDEKSLHDVFKWLGFEIATHRDCSSDEMLTLLREIGNRDHSQMDSVVCCILSHGTEGSVYGVDEETVKITDLCRPLNGLHCSSLADKPKLFFIQACQGTKEQSAVNIESDGPAESQIFSDAVALRASIPSDADFLIAMSTVPSFVSFRDKTNGTWFIQALCQNLVQMVPRGCDLMSIMTKVNGDVSRKTDAFGMRKQMPQPAFTLRKKVIFPRPTTSPPSLHFDRPSQVLRDP